MIKEDFTLLEMGSKIHNDFKDGVSTFDESTHLYNEWINKIKSTKMSNNMFINCITMAKLIDDLLKNK